MDAYQYLSGYYTGLFMNDVNLAEIRDHYAIPKNTIKDPARNGRSEYVFSFGVRGQPQQIDLEMILPIPIIGPMKN